MEYSNSIAAHEAGHCVALAAAGLAGEFVRATIKPQTNDGRNVYGLTKGNGKTLTDYSEKMGQLASQMTVDPQGPRNFHDFLVKEAPRVCLPNICFFLGGGACDRWLKREDLRRNSIDREEIYKNLFPAMTLKIGDTEMSVVQGKVDEFLFKVFEREGKLLDGLYGALVQNEEVTREDLGPLLNEMEACGERRARQDYNSLLTWFSSWYEPQVQKFEG